MSKYCATWALVRMMPCGSINTPLAEIGLRSPPVAEVQMILTAAARATSFIPSHAPEVVAVGEGVTGRSV